MPIKQSAVLLGMGLLSAMAQEDCVDVHSNCDTFVANGWCETGNPSRPDLDAAFYQARCPLGCGICNNIAPTGSPTVTPAPTFYQICEDTHSNCATFFANGWCEAGHPSNGNDADFYLQRCKGTCGLFYGTCLEAPSDAPTPTPTRSICEDFHERCDEFFTLGYCETGNPNDPDKDAEFYMKRCKKTCGVCTTSEPTSAPTPAPPTVEPTPVPTMGTLPMTPFWNCFDDHVRCPAYFLKGWCSTGNPNFAHRDAEFYRERCEYTCGQCTSCYDNFQFVCDEANCGEPGTDFNCPATCGLCPSYIGVTEPSVCSDINVQCHSTEEYCETGLPRDQENRPAEYYQTRCPVTCGRCDPYEDFVGIDLSDDQVAGLSEIIVAEDYTMASGLPAMLLGVFNGEVVAIGFNGETELTDGFSLGTGATFIKSMGKGALAVCSESGCSFFNGNGLEVGSFDGVEGSLVDLAFAFDEVSGYAVRFAAVTSGPNGIYTGEVMVAEDSISFYDVVDLDIGTSPEYGQFFDGNDITNIAYNGELWLINVGGYLVRYYPGCVMGEELDRFVHVWSIVGDASSMEFVDYNTVLVTSGGQAFLLSMDEGVNHVASVQVTLDGVGASTFLPSDDASLAVGVVAGGISILAFQDSESCRAMLSYAIATVSADCRNNGIEDGCPCEDMSLVSRGRWMDVASRCGSCAGDANEEFCAIAVAVCEADPSCRQCAAAFDGCSSLLECEATQTCAAGELYYPTECAFLTCDYAIPCPELSCSAAPTSSPSSSPTAVPSFTPSSAPTGNPTVDPTAVPSFAPSSAPTESPSSAPTEFPTAHPTPTPPTFAPTRSTMVPTHKPNVVPTAVPTLDQGYGSF